MNAILLKHGDNLSPQQNFFTNLDQVFSDIEQPQIGDTLIQNPDTSVTNILKTYNHKWPEYLLASDALITRLDKKTFNDEKSDEEDNKAEKLLLVV